ncbi:MAG TPA: nucleoside recognition domain-containing protein [Verrucomicrobiota bacterium]|nr:nucleoside recognition domain-containing protein [Verrucomicrobiota bacterium]HNT16230.1 nucleoside recognition domain-containing protein [Verrucomicrobiota bacterium]
MLNYIWLALMVAAVVIGATHDTLDAVGKAAFERAEFAVMQLALPLAGVMALWLGIMRLAEKAGLISILARLLRPLMRRLFPDVPPEHPAMGSMLMNMAANILGLSNAATPLGIRAMQDLETLNRRPGVASNAMCTFLAINTSSIQLIPATAIAVLAVAHASNAFAIVSSSIMATFCSTAAGITAVKLLEKMPGYRLPAPARDAQASRPPVPAAGRTDGATPGPPPAAASPPAPLHGLAWLVLALFAAVFVYAFLRLGFSGIFGKPPLEAFAGQNAFLRATNAISLLSIPLLLSFFPLYAALRGVKVYEEFVEGAKDGFKTAVMIMPYLVAILVAIGMFREAGGIELLTRALQPVLDRVGFPTELLPLSLVRPLSGSGTLGLFSDLVKEFGPDSLLARTAGTIFGSTETTFYVIAVYFGAVGVKRTRHAVPAGLIADGVGILAAIIICRLMFG